jgi:alpha-galactosidase
MDLSRCTAEEKEEIRSQIRTYRDNWDLFHLGDYYRLTDLSGPFVAWEQVSRDKRRAVVSLVAGGAQAAPPFRTLRLKGLDQALTYRVNGGDAAGGDVLMHAGVPLPPLWGDYQSLQLFLEAVEE